MRLWFARSLGGACLLFTLSAGVVNADTVATFADPADDGSTPLFLVGDTALSGSWGGSGLEMVAPMTGEVYSNVTFSMSPVALTGMTLSSGVIEFYADATAGGGLILRIDFDGGEMFDTLGFGASYLSGDAVTFSGPIITEPLEDESFAFSFANPIETAEGMTYTAAFTSSATVVPEPVSLSLLSLGAAALLRRRR